MLEFKIHRATVHLIEPHDLVIIGSTVQGDDAEARSWEARRIFVDEASRIRA
jgi:aspartate 1-decarboxylase